MDQALVCSPCSRLAWTSDGSSCSKLSGKCVKSLVPVRRPPAAVRSSCFQGRYAWFDPPCSADWSSPVNRDTHVQRWVEESVHEILRNIQEAPFLQYVFDSKGGLGRSQRQKIPQDVLMNADPWSPIRATLSKMDPDGVILVQKLEPSGGCSSPKVCCLAVAFQSANDDDEEEEEENVCPLLQGEGAETNVWGVLVQARGVHTNACYLLKTTRVSSSAGICTRYCLTRAKCCGPSHGDQLQNAWLL